MATIQFSTAVASLAQNPSVDLLANFDPAVDVLVVDTVDPTGLRMVVGDGALILYVNNKSLTVPNTTLAGIPATGGWLQFKAGGVMLVGDGTADMLADDGDNDMTMLATFKNDHIRGLGGADTIDAGKGADLVYGNAGDDYITGTTADAGADTVFGGLGNDVIAYAAAVAPELIYGNLGDDTLIGALQGKNRIYAGQGDDRVQGGNLDDKIYGNAGNDSILGGGGNNTVFGGQGDDSVLAGTSANGRSWVYGNLGDDSLVAGIGGDTMIGGQGNDTLYGGSGADMLRGNLGDDLIIVGDRGGKDTLGGGAGRDTFSIDMTSGGDIRIDDFIGADDRLELHGITALNLVRNAFGTSISSVTNKDLLLKATDIVLKGGNGSLVLAGAAGQPFDATNFILDGGEALGINLGGEARVLQGSALNDILVTGDLGDTLYGGGGADTALGGQGNDLLIEANGLASGTVFHAGGGMDTLMATVDGDDTITVNTSNLEHVVLTWGETDGTVHLTLTQAGAIGLTLLAPDLLETQSMLIDLAANRAGANVGLGAGNDTLIGAAISTSGDTLDGGDGDDSLVGNTGRDMLNGSGGADTIDGGAGGDTLSGGEGADVFLFTAGDSGVTATSIDRLTDFTPGEDRIVFHDGSDVTVFDLTSENFSASKTLVAALTAAYGRSDGINANDAILFDYGGATYLYVNDGTDDLSTASDLLIDVTGISGAPLGDDFTAPDSGG